MTAINPFEVPAPADAPTPLAATPLPPLEVPAPPAPDLPPAVVSLTKDELAAMLRDAVSAGAAQASAANALGTPAIMAEIPEDWSLNRLLRKLVDRAPWHTEREERAAYAAVDKHAPAPADPAVGV